MPDARALLAATIFAVGSAALAGQPGLESGFAEQAGAAKAASRTIDVRSQLRKCEETAQKLTYYRAWELKLVTDAGAYYFHEDCDICAAIDVCDPKTGAMTPVKQAHWVDCRDLAAYKKGTILFDACPTK
ncbi:MAG: hypothetical protein HY553_21540 [Elusimicrobia bacterium]|nr:hypothetical protein [Elusimicrobiota bacterium]